MHNGYGYLRFYPGVENLILSFFCLVFVMHLCASVYLCLVVTCWERADLWLSFVVSTSEFVTFPLVSWVRCGTWLYQLLIFAPLLTLPRLSYPGCHVRVIPPILYWNSRK